MLLELASAYTDALNNGKVPTIATAWDNVQAAEMDRAYKEQLQIHSELLTKEFQSAPVSEA